MSWECTQNPLACEAFLAGMKRDISNMTTRESFLTPNGRDHSRLRKLREEIFRLKLANDDPAGEKLDHSLLHRLWQGVVEAYSICDLTFFDKDKLMAMAGIASRVGRLMRSDYIAGSFRDMLPRGLLWKVEQPGSFSKDATQKILIPPKKFRLPSPDVELGKSGQRHRFRRMLRVYEMSSSNRAHRHYGCQRTRTESVWSYTAG